MDQASGDRARFEALYAAHHEAVARYALRRTASSDDAVDVLGETFLIAWRRLDDVPDGDGARLWLYGVARRVLANHRRGAARRELLLTRLRAEFAEAAPERHGAAAEIRAAFARLSGEDRELLSLTGWEGLTPEQAATVLGRRAATVRVRLHRARKRFARALADEGVDVERYGARAVALAEGALR
ncbi:sigma-70 family RNA polymerase sigma factor [Actinomadura kijaniata]|uniref:RNA polymerase sigma-70 factor (ECF subfamily) n=1 Tax=Actinomadura namibiensis TaxID=182080 RepID=A0A7W3QJJ1_ACTNM|nr:RNA polymerase sigma factor [Actinomadura namibiensis]MBA8949003.1 RNA polymerase sigma-70 factor (ECF subfamily) [Actinomadura namibiensis]